MKKIKKRWFVLAGIFILAVVLFFTFGLSYIKRHFTPNEANVSEIIKGEQVKTDQKILTVYFTRVGNSNFEEDIDAVSSASLLKDGETLYGNSQVLAQMVQNIVGGDLYAIETKEKYPSGYGDTTGVAKEELDENARPELTSQKIDLSQYDTIVLVFPVWWGTYPMPVASFLDQYDLTGKKIMPLATHGGSSFGSSLDDLKENYKADFTEGLAIFDDDVKDNAREEIVEWFEKNH